MKGNSPEIHSILFLQPWIFFSYLQSKCAEVKEVLSYISKLVHWKNFENVMWKIMFVCKLLFCLLPKHSQNKNSVCYKPFTMQAQWDVSVVAQKRGHTSYYIVYTSYDTLRLWNNHLMKVCIDKSCINAIMFLLWFKSICLLL